MSNRLLNVFIKEEDFKSLTISQLTDFLDEEFICDKVYINRILSPDALYDTGGHTVITLESNEFKEISEGSIIPQVFAKWNTGYGSCGEMENYLAVEDYTQYLETNKFSPVVYLPENNEINYVNLVPEGVKQFEVIEFKKHLQNMNQQIESVVELMGKNKLTEKVCECGKEKHNFMRHMEFCPKFE